MPSARVARGPSAAPGRWQPTGALQHPGHRKTGGGRPGFPVRRQCRVANANQTSPTGCDVVPPSGPATPADGHRTVGTAARQGSHGHLHHRLFTDRAEFSQCLRGHRQVALLGLVGIRDVATLEPLANCPDTSVSNLATRPPVQDSAVTTRSPRRSNCSPTRTASAISAVSSGALNSREPHPDLFPCVAGALFLLPAQCQRQHEPARGNACGNQREHRRGHQRSQQLRQPAIDRIRPAEH